MQVIPFWGCMIALKYPQMEKAVRACLGQMDVELVDETRFSCCPDPIYYKAADRKEWLTIAARNISIAEENGLNMITMCSGCTSTLCEVNHILKKDESLRAEINKRLEPIGRQFRGSIDVKHIVTYLRDDLGLDKVAQTVRYPLENIKVAIHYGCHLLKPSDVMNVDDPVVPNILAQLLEITGATPIDHREYLLCCGKACQDQDLPLKMSHDVFQSVKDSGADCLGLICPTCFDSFDIGQLRVSRHFKKKFEIPVVYIFQLLAIAQGMPPEEVGIDYHKIMPAVFRQKLQQAALIA